MRDSEPNTPELGVNRRHVLSLAGWSATLAASGGPPSRRPRARRANDSPVGREARLGRR